MESTEDDEELKLVKASATLLSDLESALPKLLWRPADPPSSTPTRVHSCVEQRDLDYIVKLIEPFQGEPQLLDARLKYIVPPLVNAYLVFLETPSDKTWSDRGNLEEVICTILYTLCKVRGHKVIVGFLSNEPRYLDIILVALEDATGHGGEKAAWQVLYIQLLWVSHLLLTPFDLVSISDNREHGWGFRDVQLPQGLPTLAVTTYAYGSIHLWSSNKAQEAAAAVLVRLVIRPDMQRVQLADAVVESALQTLTEANVDDTGTIHKYLGQLRLLAGIANSADLAHLFPKIYKICDRLANEDEGSLLTRNAVAKKMLIKIFRNIAIHSLRSASAGTVLLEFLETTSVLESVVEYLLSSLGDRDTPVRFAAAKAISLITLELEPSMGHDIIQAILDTYKEDMPEHSGVSDFRTANPLKWHGLTLALGHALFKRIAAPEQLPEIVTALVLAMQFEQRTATSSSIGTNVRDAANFGIWSMSRRYTTEELLAVDTSSLQFGVATNAKASVIQAIATQLILSACLDPAGNIRRGSSAALQELIGRHPNQVFEGIALVQMVEYQAVGLRRRAMIEVASQAAALHPMYHSAIIDGLLGWRGLGSADVSSREAAGRSVARLHAVEPSSFTVPNKLMVAVQTILPTKCEAWHGIYFTLACIMDEETRQVVAASHDTSEDAAVMHGLYSLVEGIPEVLSELSPRVLRSETPTASAYLISCYCNAASNTIDTIETLPFASMDLVVERLLARQEDTILDAIPMMVQRLFAARVERGVALENLAATALSSKVSRDGNRNSLVGAGRAVALGALTCLYGGGLTGEQAATGVATLADLVSATSVDWRVVGLRALQLVLKAVLDDTPIDTDSFKCICDAVLRGMRDYTIDERGDVGSLVRLRALTCASTVLHMPREQTKACSGSLDNLRANIVRLSLEKLDRVRLQAAKCLSSTDGSHNDIAAVSTYAYFDKALRPLENEADPLLCTALLEGCISCAGVAAESLLQASRAALIDTLCRLDTNMLYVHITSLSTILKVMVQDGGPTLPALELLAYLLDMRTLHALIETDFKWRNLLSTVQKSHHKSNDIPKILAAVHVYRGLADVEAIRGEVLKKLLGMLKTNPYPVVRVHVAETLWMVVGDEALLAVDWTRDVKSNVTTVARLHTRHVG